MARFLSVSVTGSVLGLLVIAAPAAAQPAPTPAPTDDGGTPVDLPEDTTVEDPSGVNENPDAPTDPTGPAPTTTVVQAPVEERKGYPIEDVLRPITMPRLMSEVGLDFRNNLDPYIGNVTVRGRFGITDKVQVGLEYTIGGFFDAVDTEDKIKFNTGKSIGVDVAYSVFDWLAVRLALPFYLDPFAMGVTLGAPLKFRIGDKLAIGGMGDFLSIKLRHFVPSTINEAYNDAQAALVDTNSVDSAGSLRFSGFITYQLKPNVAIGGDFSMLYEDFDDSDVPYSFHLRGQYSMGSRLDFGLALGFGDLANAGDTIEANVYGQFRI
jgi:hypothetical protein